MSLIKIFITNLNKEIFLAENQEKNLMEALHSQNIRVQSNCEGNGVCGKCHIILDEKTYKKFEIDEAEEDVLAGLMDCEPTSRLACKLSVTNDLDGASITIKNLK